MTKLIKGNAFDYINFNKAVEGGQSLAIPNEIFEDLMNHFKIGKCAYAYSYYYLSMYLYIYAKYGTEETVEKFTTQGIQKFLGISPSNRSMFDVTKKSGFLDTMGYTSTTTDYPVLLYRMQRTEDHIMEVHHYMYSEEKRDSPNIKRHSNNFTVKHPDKMFWRTPDDKMDDYYNGTMNQPDYSHILPVEMFLHAMSIPDIMTKGFFVYGFIKYKSDIRKGKGWTITPDLMAHDLGSSKGTIVKMIRALEKHGFIYKIRNKTEDGIDMPNTYIPNLDPSKVVYHKK